MSARRTVTVRIAGRVQGVGYRQWLARSAEALGLVGWVRNRADGTVEAVLSGRAVRVDEMIGACRGGPRLARVTSVTAAEAEDEGWSDFSIRPTL